MPERDVRVRVTGRKATALAQRRARAIRAGEVEAESAHCAGTAEARQQCREHLCSVRQPLLGCSLVPGLLEGSCDLVWTRIHGATVLSPEPEEFPSLLKHSHSAQVSH